MFFAFTPGGGDPRSSCQPHSYSSASSTSPHCTEGPHETTCSMPTRDDLIDDLRIAGAPPRPAWHLRTDAQRARL